MGSLHAPEDELWGRPLGRIPGENVGGCDRRQTKHECIQPVSAAYNDETCYGEEEIKNTGMHVENFGPSRPVEPKVENPAARQQSGSWIPKELKTKEGKNLPLVPVTSPKI